jgi:hypothetical protein
MSHSLGGQPTLTQVGYGLHRLQPVQTVRKPRERRLPQTGVHSRCTGSARLTPSLIVEHQANRGEREIAELKG